MRNFKEARRTQVLQILETREFEAAKAEERNEVRELSEEEQCLKDFAFPEKLALPVDKRFRLWLSTVPVPGFPQDFARRSNPGIHTTCLTLFTKVSFPPVCPSNS